MRLFFLAFIFSITLVNSQNNYPQDYFGSPLEVPLILSGTFAELRSNHFHSGLDIKTQQRVGLKVNASADGYVSRIKISHYGYGKALYITHPNGYTTVYAHLQKFSPEIEAYIKKRQYEKETYQIELFPSAKELLVQKKGLVAYSGNSGGSGGPHLHFEIRDKKEHPINPLLFGIDIKDNIAPTISSVYMYDTETNTKKKLRLTPLKNGDYKTESIEAYGTIGFGIESIDRLNNAANKNGVYNIQTFINGSRSFEVDFRSFSFEESKHINKFIDYEHYKTNKVKIQKLFKKENPLSLLKSKSNNGYVKIKDSTANIYKIRVSDFKNNESWITININGKKPKVKKETPLKTTPYLVKTREATNLKKDKISVDFYKDTFYEDFYIDFDVKNDTLTLHKDIIPAKKNFNITYNIDAYSGTDKDKLYIARLVGSKKYSYYTSTKRKEDVLIASTKRLGTYALAVDTISPTTERNNFKAGQWMSKYRYLKVKINDKGGSGISNYRATVNGKWILMEYDYKTKILTYDFNDGIITDTKNNLKVIVTDNVGNNSTFETLFYRK